MFTSETFICKKPPVQIIFGPTLEHLFAISRNTKIRLKIAYIVQKSSQKILKVHNIYVSLPHSTTFDASGHIYVFLQRVKANRKSWLRFTLHTLIWQICMQGLNFFNGVLLMSNVYRLISLWVIEYVCRLILLCNGILLSRNVYGLILFCSMEHIYRLVPLFLYHRILILHLEQIERIYLHTTENKSNRGVP